MSVGSDTPTPDDYRKPGCAPLIVGTAALGAIGLAALQEMQNRAQPPQQPAAVIRAEDDARREMIAALNTLSEVARNAEAYNDAYYQHMRTLSIADDDAQREDPDRKSPLRAPGSAYEKAEKHYMDVNYPDFGEAVEGWKSAWQMLRRQSENVRESLSENRLPDEHDVKALLAASRLINADFSGKPLQAPNTRHDKLYLAPDPQIAGGLLTMGLEGKQDDTNAAAIAKDFETLLRKDDTRLRQTMQLLGKELPALQKKLEAGGPNR